MRGLVFTGLFLIVFSVGKAQMQYEYKVVRVDPVNSKHDELAPVVSGDGNKLFFVRGYTDEAQSNYLDQDIMYSRRINDTTWSKPIPISINTEDQPEVVCGSNYDGTMLLVTYYQEVNEDGETKFYPHPAYIKLDPSAGQWASPEKIEVKNLEKIERADYTHFYFHITPAADGSLFGEHMFLSFTPKGTYGEKLYYAHKVGENSYDEPKPLKGEMDSNLFETSPFYYAAGDKLYFTSNRGHASSSKKRNKEVNNLNKGKIEEHQSAQIYGAYRQADSWVRWEAIRDNDQSDPILSVVNEDAFDAYLFLYPEQKREEGYVGFFVRDRDGDEGDDTHADIFELRFSKDTIPPPPIACNTTLVVNTYDADSRLPIAAEVEVTNASQDTLLLPVQKNEKGSQYVYTVIQTGEYSAFGSKDKYVPDRKSIDIQDSNPKVLDLYLKPKISTDQDLLTFFFEFAIPRNQAQVQDPRIFAEPLPNDQRKELSDEDIRALNVKIARIKEILDRSTSAKIYFYGYADKVGDVASNQALSLRRINAVRNYLISQGVEEGRIGLIDEQTVLKEPKGEQEAQYAEGQVAKRGADRKVRVRIEITEEKE